MDLRATHYGYAYQDLVTGIALVDLMLGTAMNVTVDTKGAKGDLFDDLTISYRGDLRVRLQIKHTSLDRRLAKSTFSGNSRSLRLDLLFDSLLADLAMYPGTTYRVVVRDGDPDEDLATVLKPVTGADDPGDPLPGLATRRFRFDPKALRQTALWKNRIANLTDTQVSDACASLVIDTGAPAATLDFSDPGPAERLLLRRVVEELGAGRTPNTHITPDHAALALAHAATAARSREGEITREGVLPRVGLTTDFGAVAEGHPIERTVAVPRVGATAEVRQQIDWIAPIGGRVVVTGEPGVGKSWLAEQVADLHREEDWVVARHHCWLGSTDSDRDARVLTEVVIGSLLRQLERLVPEATAKLRPRFAATAEALAAAVRACREIDAQRNVLLIVDGIDHVDRVLGRNTQQVADPSRLLVDQLAAIDLPPGACMLIVSQPGPHLDTAVPADGELLQMSPMSWDEVRTLAQKHGLLEATTGPEVPIPDEARAVVDILHSQSGGNALYATYLCRGAMRVSPLDPDGTPPITTHDVVHRLGLIPDTATDLDTYYTHLLEGMTDGQDFAIGMLALCDFALSAEELGEILPAVKPLLKSALQTLAPVLTSQPGLGGLRIHHESFGRHILRGKDADSIGSIRSSAAAWLAARGFFNDARAFRHLPQMLAHLDRYDELKELIKPGFVAHGIQALQPPEALTRVIGVVARESAARFDWPTLVTCIETRKSIDTYESESLSASIVDYADVVVTVLGAEAVSERLMYDGRPTFPSCWGLRLCEAVDRAGSAAPWGAYLDARTVEADREHTSYSSDNDGTLQLAMQLGALRLRAQRGEIEPAMVGEIAQHLQRNHQASLADVIEVFAVGLPTGYVPDIVAAITDPEKAALAYLALADLADRGLGGLPDPTDLARKAWEMAPTADIIGYLRHGIPAAEVLAGLGITDLRADLRTATDVILGRRPVDYSTIEYWLSLVTLAHAVDRTIPLELTDRLSGIGFYRAWLRYTVATVGIAADVEDGTRAPDAASKTVLIALTDLVAEAKPFTGSPRASDLYSVHALVQEVIENSLVVVQPAELDAVLEHLIAIGDGTTTSLMGLRGSGPLTTNDLLELLSRVSDRVGVSAVHSLVKVIRERRDDTNTQYAVSADFELATARICLTAGAPAEADECWHRACVFLAGYGGHKDPTISEIIDSVEDLAGVDVTAARAALAKLADLTCLVRQHTDGRGTSHVVKDWWAEAARFDPTAAARDGAETLLADPGFEDARVYTAHTYLLENQVTGADPIVVAALRLTAGTDWREPATDLQLLTRLRGELGQGPASDVLLAVVANTIAATYDDQAIMYSSDHPPSVAMPELVEAVVRLGGSAFPVRVPRVEKDRGTTWPPAEPKPAPTALQRRIVRSQCPVVPADRAGLIVAVREFEAQRYRDDVLSAWDLSALSDAVGWRVLETSSTDGAEAAIELLDDVARAMGRYSENNELFVLVGEGLALRCDDGTGELRTVASYCLTLAYTRIRGGGGWRTFADRKSVHLWTTAQALDPVTADRTLANSVAAIAASEVDGAYGVTQGLIAAFAASSGGTAISCWEAACAVIQHRLPGKADRAGHTYHPTATDTPEGLDLAMATMAIATIAQPMRADLRRALLAATLLLVCRPAIAKRALVPVLAADLDAGRTTWLLDVVRTYLLTIELGEEMAAELTRLTASDWLSVRTSARQILEGKRDDETQP